MTELRGDRVLVAVSDTGVGIAVGVATINACFVIATAWVGSRIGGWRTERWALLMCAALAWAMGSELLIDIWQPHALLLSPSSQRRHRPSMLEQNSDDAAPPPPKARVSASSPLSARK